METIIAAVLGGVVGAFITSYFVYKTNREQQRFLHKKEQLLILQQKAEESIVFILSIDLQVRKFMIDLKNGEIYWGMDVDSSLRMNQDKLASNIYIYFPEIEKKYNTFALMVYDFTEIYLSIASKASELGKYQPDEEVKKKLIKLANDHEEIRTKFVDSLQTLMKEYKNELFKN
jgi:hypothetical protein